MPTKTETKSWWECKEDDCDKTYESPVFGTLTVGHTGASYDRKNHEMRCVKRTKHDELAVQDRRERHRGPIWYD